jgi:hypothetical protein
MSAWRGQRCTVMRVGERGGGRTKLEALLRTFQGAKPHTPIVMAIIWPRLMLMYLGARAVMSLAAEIELAVLCHAVIRRGLGGGIRCRLTY